MPAARGETWVDGCMRGDTRGEKAACGDAAKGECWEQLDDTDTGL